ncbi:ras-related protein Rab-26 isoform X3 [Clupea harengus]|uniref:small monomeric GTPase n=1 Tax=Clupea harengus TaxID=7950 RepID=A0A6P8F6Q7_CLUHA|nr:ras-related protein Rab-26 isoform X3 [Clupea harengus]
MSRKKPAKGKAGSSTPTASPNSKESCRSAKGAAASGQTNGVIHPSRPSLSNSGEFYDLAFKVMLVGDSGVGKTCLLVRFKDGAFLAGSFISTVGIDFRNKVLSIDGVKVKLQIWDTAGQERFRSVTHAYYRDAHALLLLYDVANKASFDNIQRQVWILQFWTGLGCFPSGRFWILQFWTGLGTFPSGRVWILQFWFLAESGGLEARFLSHSGGCILT